MTVLLLSEMEHAQLLCGWCSHSIVCRSSWVCITDKQTNRNAMKLNVGLHSAQPSIGITTSTIYSFKITLNIFKQILQIEDLLTK